MRNYLLIATGIAVLAGTGAAMAQMPPGGGPDEHRERWEMMRHARHEDDGAAFFRFKRGDAAVDIKCPKNENVQSCVAAAGTLMDKLASMQPPKTP